MSFCVFLFSVQSVLTSDVEIDNTKCYVCVVMQAGFTLNLVVFLLLFDQK